MTRLAAWHEANRYLSALNALRWGAPSRQPRCRVYVEDNFVTPAQFRARSVALREAKRIALVRSGHGQSAHAIPKLLKSVHVSSCSASKPVEHRIALLADAIDEPEHEVVVPTLECLSPEEAEFDSTESHVVELEGKSSTIFQEIEAHYGFVAGPTDE